MHDKRGKTDGARAAHAMLGALTSAPASRNILNSANIAGPPNRPLASQIILSMRQLSSPILLRRGGLLGELQTARQFARKRCQCAHTTVRRAQLKEREAIT